MRRELLLFSRSAGSGSRLPCSTSRDGVALDLPAARAAKTSRKIDRGPSEIAPTTAIAEGVEALNVEQFVGELLHIK